MNSSKSSMEHSRKDFIDTKHFKKKPKTWLYVFVILVVLCTGALTSLFYLKPRLIWNKPSDNGVSHFESSEIDDNSALTIYFPNNGGLTPTKIKPSLKSTRTGVAEDIARQYLKQYNSQLNNCFLSTSGIVYLDISENLRRNFRGSVMDEYLLIMGLLRSFEANISGIKAVRILIDGNEIESLGGHINLTHPIRDK